MRNIPKEQVDAAFKALPNEAQNAILSSETATKIGQVAGIHSLPDDKATLLGTAATLVLLGLLDSDEFSHALTADVGLPEERAQTVLHELRTTVFDPVAALGVSPGLGVAGGTGVGEAQENSALTAEVSKRNPYDGTDPYHEQVR